MRAAAVQWLRYERQCAVVALERGPGLCGIPDVIGVNGKRHLIEIEIKRTMQDFRHNNKKWKIRQRRLDRMHRDFPIYATPEPQQFYFLVEPKMVEKCRGELPDYAGLMSLPAEDEPHRTYTGIPFPVVRVPSPTNKHAARLTVRACVAMAKNQSGTLSSVIGALANFRQLDNRTA